MKIATERPVLHTYLDLSSAQYCSVLLAIMKKKPCTTSHSNILEFEVPID